MVGLMPNVVKKPMMKNTFSAPTRLIATVYTYVPYDVCGFYNMYQCCLCIGVPV
jgi:hypothetical protein